MGGTPQPWSMERNRPCTRHPRHRSALERCIPITFVFDNQRGLTLQVCTISKTLYQEFKKFLGSGETGRQQETERPSITNNSSKIQHRAAVWKTAGVYIKEIYLLISELALVEPASLGDFKNKIAGRHHFSSIPGLDTQTPVGTLYPIPTFFCGLPHPTHPTQQESFQSSAWHISFCK